MIQYFREEYTMRRFTRAQNEGHVLPMHLRLSLSLVSSDSIIQKSLSTITKFGLIIRWLM